MPSKHEGIPMAIIRSIHATRSYTRMVSNKTGEWLRVPLDHLTVLGLLKRVSPFSKRDGKFVWLEKSIDAVRFRHAFEHYTGNKFEDEEVVVDDSIARSLPHYFA